MQIVFDTKLTDAKPLKDVTVNRLRGGVRKHAQTDG